MPRFFVDQKSIADGCIVLEGEDARHLSFSMRARPGDLISVCSNEGLLYKCALISLDGKRVRARILSAAPAAEEPCYEAVLCQAIPKGDKMELIIQKAVELGVARIIPVESSRCVARVKPEARLKKTERWNKIAEAAAKQCGRGRVPVVEAPVLLQTLLDRMGSVGGDSDSQSDTGSFRFFCYEGGGQPLKEVFCGHEFKGCEHPKLYFLIGPEGGFAAEEAQEAQRAGWQPVTLGRRILRTETASFYCLSALSYEREVSSLSGI